MSPLSALQFQSRLVKGTGQEYGPRVETVLAFGRVFLSFIALLAIRFGAGEPTPYSSTAYRILVLYAIYSVAVLVGVKLTEEASFTRLPFLIHAIDLLWPAVAAFLIQGPESPFFVLLMFAVLAAGYRWGAQATVGTASITLLLFSLKGASHSVFSNQTQSDLVGTAYLLAMGFLIANLVDNQRRAQAHISAVARALGGVRLQRGLRASVQAALGELLRVFEAERILIALEETRTQDLHLWEGRQGAGSSGPIESFSKGDSASREKYLFTLPAHTFHAARRTSHFSGPSRMVGLDADGNPTECAPGDFPAGFPWDGSRTVTATSLAMADEWQGRLFLFNARRGRKARQELRFLQTFVQQLMPALYGAYALGRIRTRAGAVERLRVARELHDGSIQSMIAAEMHVDALRRRLAEEGNGVAEELEQIQQLLRNEVINLRALMQQLKPLDLDAGEFTGYITDMVERFRKETGRAIEFVTEVEAIDLPPMVLSELAKIVQEALANIRKHSQAQKVHIQLSDGNDKYKIVVDDDGQGLGWAGRLTLRELQAMGRGPMMIKERVQGIGGELIIDSAPGRGTRLEIMVPRRSSLIDETTLESSPYSDR